ncbi:GspH/FimT family pseudopilin [Hydromonas duriensis]|uniref:Type II secretion system protein H n=1 Tax=Hydromonas duriensis TaxID=1527608 RepID=A0A4R6Y8V2_9BURK|nr:GspH/FimT family pseudopilin [Hydromonas duriensis]TDR31855.1 prepilin-type N-terminal cleavage/methylation domain-containing protein [Hydromonas duriensis]
MSVVGLKTRHLDCWTNGYTLLETLMVLAMAAIISVLVVPNFQYLLAQREVDRVAAQMAQQMETARVFAQANAVEVVGCPVTSNQSKAVVGVVAPCLSLASNQAWHAWIWYVKGEGNVLMQVLARSETVPAGVSLTTGGRMHIVFGAQGLATGFNGTITVASAQAMTVRSISLASTGRVTLN